MPPHAGDSEWRCAAQEEGCGKEEVQEECSTRDAVPGDREYFEVYVMKVTPCPKRCVHDWSLCPFAHCGEKARRRDPRVHTGIACVSMKQEGTCSRGDRCPHAHSAWEYWLHPTRYHTAMCSQGAACSRKFCFFAHDPSELRKPSVRPGAPPAATTFSLQQPSTPSSGQHLRQPLRQAAVSSSSSSSSFSSCDTTASTGSGSLPSNISIACQVPASLSASSLHTEQLGAAPAHAQLAAAAGASWGAFGSSGFGSSGPLAPPSPPPGASSSHSYPSRALDLPPSPTPAQPLGFLPPTANQQHKEALSGSAVQAIIQAVAGEMASGRLDASTAASMLNQLLPPQELVQLMLAGGELPMAPPSAAAQGSSSFTQQLQWQELHGTQGCRPASSAGLSLSLGPSIW